MCRLSPRPIPAPSPLPRSSRKLLPPSFLLQLGRRASSATASDRRTSTACSASSVKQLTPCSSSAVTTASAWTISGETASASTRDNERDDERDEGLGFQPGDRLVHVKHGLGVAVGYLPDGRLEIAFDDGQRHKYKAPSVARKIAPAPADAPPPPISVPARSRGKLSAFFVKGLVEESLVELSAATAAALRSLDPAAAVPAAPPREETLERALLAIFGSFDVRRASVCRAGARTPTRGGVQAPALRLTRARPVAGAVPRRGGHRAAAPRHLDGLREPAGAARAWAAAAAARSARGRRRLLERPAPRAPRAALLALRARPCPPPPAPTPAGLQPARARAHARPGGGARLAPLADALVRRRGRLAHLAAVGDVALHPHLAGRRTRRGAGRQKRARPRPRPHPGPPMKRRALHTAGRALGRPGRPGRAVAAAPTHLSTCPPPGRGNGGQPLARQGADAAAPARDPAERPVQRAPPQRGGKRGERPAHLEPAPPLVDPVGKRGAVAGQLRVDDRTVLCGLASKRFF